jgi:hypothetical protein
MPQEDASAFCEKALDGAGYDESRGAGDAPGRIGKDQIERRVRDESSVSALERRFDERRVALDAEFLEVAGQRVRGASVRFHEHRVDRAAR